MPDHVVEPSQQGARVTSRYGGLTNLWDGVTLVLRPQYSTCKKQKVWNSECTGNYVWLTGTFGQRLHTWDLFSGVSVYLDK